MYNRLQKEIVMGRLRSKIPLDQRRYMWFNKWRKKHPKTHCTRVMDGYRRRTGWYDRLPELIKRLEKEYAVHVTGIGYKNSAHYKRNKYNLWTMVKRKIVKYKKLLKEKGNK